MAEKRVKIKKVKKLNLPSPEKTVATAYPQLIHKLRELTFKVKEGQTWITSLPDKRLLELYHMFKNNEPSDLIIEHAYTRWSIPVRNDKTNAAIVTRYRTLVTNSSILFIEAATDEERKLRVAFMKRAKAVVSELNPVEELTRLLLEMKRRVDTLLDHEIADGEHSTQATQELLNYNRMLHEHVKLLQSLGLMDETPKKHILEMRDKFENGVMKLVSDSHAEDRFVEMGNNFLAGLDAAAVECSINDDGTYEVSE